jgi:hypothetical protein
MVSKVISVDKVRITDVGRELDKSESSSIKTGVVEADLYLRGNSGGVL